MLSTEGIDMANPSNSEDSGLEDAKIAWLDGPGKKRRRQSVAIVVVIIAAISTVALARGYGDTLDLSDHHLTTIGTWAEVAILVWMVWERFNPKPEASVKPLEYANPSKDWLDYLVENRTLIFAAAGLAVVVWLNFREQPAPAPVAGFTSQQVDDAVATKTQSLQVQLQGAIQGQKNLQEENNHLRGILGETNKQLGEETSALQRYFALSDFIETAQDISKSLDSPILFAIRSPPAHPSHPGPNLGEMKMQERAKAEWGVVLSRTKDLYKKAYNESPQIDASPSDASFVNLSGQLSSLIDRMRKEEADLLGQLRAMSQPRP